jgi:hypothetical protein
MVWSHIFSNEDKCYLQQLAQEWWFKKNKIVKLVVMLFLRLKSGGSV